MAGVVSRYTGISWELSSGLGGSRCYVRLLLLCSGIGTYLRGLRNWNWQFYAVGWCLAGRQGRHRSSKFVISGGKEGDSSLVFLL